jgi:shikimate kinase
MKSSIALIGYMGTGKTAVGKVLAEKLGKEFIELDAEIEKQAGLSIPEIFRRDGETGFRQKEIEVTRAISDRKNAVIACGGGIVLNKINIDRLKKECVIVCLTASPAVIIKRTATDGGRRPLLPVADQVGKIKEMLKYRRPFYDRAADFVVNTSRLKPESVAGEIIKKIMEYESKYR